MKIINFFKESLGELRKVVWPTRSEALASLRVVLVSTVLVALFLGLVDAFFVACISWIF